MNTWMKTHQLKMNSTPNQGGGGGSSQQAAPKDNSQATPAGSAPAVPAAGASAETQVEDVNLGGYGVPAVEEVSVGEYNSDGSLKEKPQKPHEQIKLKYELDNLQGLNDDEVLAIKDFAAKNNLSKETAKAYVEDKKAEALKFQKASEQAKVDYSKRVKDYKVAEIAKLKTEIGGENGKDFPQNLKKISSFLDQHIPELKKEIDEKGVFLSASVMKGIFNLQAKLKTDDKLVIGDAAGGGQKDNQPTWEKRYK